MRDAQKLEAALQDAVSGAVRLLAEGHDRFRVFTPFMFDDGDHFSIVAKSENGNWLFTDEGHTFMHLSYEVQTDSMNKGTRARIIADALEHFGVRVGVDVAKQAANLVKKRLDDETEQGKLGDKVPQVHHIDFRNADDRPSRTDIAGMRSPDAAIRMRLYGVQGGNCALCGTHFDHNRHFHLDHKTPKAKGGPDIDANLQLLCAHCNAVKGDRTMAQARELLQKWGYAA